MPELIVTAAPVDKALSVHPAFTDKKVSDFAEQSRQQEFNLLVIASDCELQQSIAVPVRRILAGTLFGKGQMADIADAVRLHEAGVVFVNHQLSPVQQRNLEKAWSAKVVDRTGLILEIFAARARTREGVLQVELASLTYQLGRLVRSWTHLERQRGGFGFLGGPGERQIELDRRMIRGRIKSLRKDLDKVRRMRATQRKGRQRKAIPTVALVGYTNAGKSTLFNRLTGADVYADDRLFATLDPTLRLLELDDGGRVMLSDTVGFVQELPHELVDAFRATLEEVIEADLILHVRDAAAPQVIEQGQVVEQTLAQLGLEGDVSPPVIEVWNKVDLVPDVRSVIREGISGSRVAVSALTGKGVNELTTLLSGWLAQEMVELKLTLAISDGRSLAFCYEKGEVLSKTERGDVVNVVVRLHVADAGRFNLNLESGGHCLKEV
ncbi:MAG: GTPase HflX [Mariprofundaceae bacterium]